MWRNGFQRVPEVRETLLATPICLRVALEGIPINIAGDGYGHEKLGFFDRGWAVDDRLREANNFFGRHGG